MGGLPIKDKENKLFTISDFAKLSRTTMSTLHYYDTIGLFSPILRKENNYRYYSAGQLANINVIHTLQRLGVTLSEIKDIKDKRTPEFAEEILIRQIEDLDNKTNSIIEAKKLLTALLHIIQSGIEAEQEIITIQFLPSEPIILGEPNDYSGEKDTYDALLSFYGAMNDKYPNLDLNYPVWGFYSPENIKQRHWGFPERYYFYNPEGTDKKPSALYAVGYSHAGYGQCEELYKRMADYIDRNGFEICGNTYEEYPLNEICVTDDENYLLRIMINVREKGHALKLRQDLYSAERDSLTMSAAAVKCPRCNSSHVTRYGRTKTGVQRYKCQNKDCSMVSFMLNYTNKGYEYGIDETIISMAANGSGVRGTARVLGVSLQKVVDTLKKHRRE